MRVEWYIGDFSDPEAVSGSSTRSKRDSQAVMRAIFSYDALRRPWRGFWTWRWVVERPECEDGREGILGAWTEDGTSDGDVGAFWTGIVAGRVGWKNMLKYEKL